MGSNTYISSNLLPCSSAESHNSFSCFGKGFWWRNLGAFLLGSHFQWDIHSLYKPHARY